MNQRIDRQVAGSLATRDVVASAPASAVASELGRAIDAKFDSVFSGRNNPYVPRQKHAGKEVEFAAVVPMFDAGEVAARISAAIADKPPSVTDVTRKFERLLARKVAEAEFDIVSTAYHADGSIASIAVSDPVYVAEVKAIARRSA